MMRGASRAFRSARLTWQRLLKTSGVRSSPSSSPCRSSPAPSPSASRPASSIASSARCRARPMPRHSPARSTAWRQDQRQRIAATPYEAQRNGFQNGVSGVTVTVNARRPRVERLDRERRRGDRHQVASSALASVLSSSLAAARFTMTARSVAAQSSARRRRPRPRAYRASTAVSWRSPPAAEQGVSFTSFNNFTSDCIVFSNGTSTGTTSTTRRSTWRTSTTRR